MATTATPKKFKKVRIHKEAKNLNVAIDKIVDWLTENGHADALAGNGINASIVSEEAHLDLLDHFSKDRENRARVQERREAQEAAFSDAIEEDFTTEDAVAEEETEAPSEASREEESVEPNTEPATELDETSSSEEEIVSEPEKDEDSVSELTADPEGEVELPADEDPSVKEPEVEGEVEGKEEEESTEEAEAVSGQEEEVEAVHKENESGLDDQDTEVSSAEKEEDQPEDEPITGEDAETDDVISADRYRLQGTKILGTIDLQTVEGGAVPGQKRRGKRKRKRKKVASSTKTAQSTTTATQTTKSTTKHKRKRKPKVDSEDVGQSVQDTLRSLDQGNVRVRQRRRRARRQQRAEERLNIEIEKEERSRQIRVTEFVSTGELADLMGIQVTEIISMLLNSGMMVSINQRLDADTIAYVADEFGCTVEFITEFGSDDIVVEEEDDPVNLTPRAPVVTVMGHVDHGKTSLLDYVRNSSVAAGESGGITQHIGAYKVALEDNRVVTFLDTPGHEAFTAMRARGAKVTDVVILVVAANDSVMPQTIEAINHAKAADVALIIAINKIDLEQADTQRVMKELSDYNVLVEQYGGNVQCAFVSAKTGEGIDDLLEKVLLEADLLELKGNSQRHAQGIVIESRLDRGRGNIATVLVQNGTLKVGDPFVAGIYGGRVRAMFDERDNRIQSAGPSEPALVLGLPGQPTVGDQLAGVGDESEAREISQRRQQIWREQKMRQYKHVRLEDIGRRMALGDFNELNLIIKADVGGSVEAISDSLHKISTDEVAVSIIHAGVGAITESDVMLASASDAVIIGFQVRPTAGARAVAEREEIDIRTYSIIYDAIEDVRDALEGLLTPEETETITGVAEVREVFKVPKIGAVAGCYISEGRIRRSDTVHILRESIVIYKGRLASLRRFKDDVREVVTGYECGIGVENYNDLKVGDQIEAFEMVKTKRTLEVS